MIKFLCAAWILWIATGCAPTKEIQNVPLLWTPTSDMNMGSVSHSDLAGVTFDVRPFVDSRPVEQQKRIGESVEFYPSVIGVTTKDNVPYWVTSRFVDLMRIQDFRVIPGGNVIVTGKVLDFFAQENTEYKGRIKVHLKFTTRTGEVLWEGVLAGASSRFGRSYNLENYYEALSDAMLDGFLSLVKDTSVLSSLQKAAKTNATAH